jgi:hypothetical protein
MNVLFVHIPKTAGGSIYRWWNTNLADSKFQLIRNKHLTASDATQQYDTSFTVTRNTYNKLISLYVFQEHKCYQKIRKNYKINFYNNILDAWNKGIVYYLQYAIDNEFNGVKSQVEYIQGVEHILSTENLKEDFKLIQQWSNCNTPLEKNVHVGQYNKDNFLTKDYVRFIEKNFEEEIELFNYKPY